jgi:ABC-type glycerol-3-phosphate transport system substrate-binding protein
MKNRIFSFVLALTLVLSTLLGCTAGGEESDTDLPKDGSETIYSGAEVPTHKVPKADFDGETFNSLCYKMNTTNYYYFTDEEAAGDPIKEALWQRDELIEEHLNVNLTADMREGNESEAVATLLRDDMAGDLDSYQQVLMHTISGVADVVANGFVYDFSALPNVDLTAEWWDLDDMESLRLGKIYPYGRSDFVISAPHVVTFNKTLVQNFNLDNPYALVTAKTWTLDKMLEMGCAVADDLNNDGEYTGDHDRFGICTSEVSKFNSFLMSCNQPVTKKNSDGRLELALNTEKTVKIIEKFADYRKVGGSIHIDVYELYAKHMEKIFAENRCLFALYDLSFLEQLRDFDVDYGIVPYPKFDVDQQEYRSQDWGPMWAVPAAIKNPELVGSVVELYSYFSTTRSFPRTTTRCSRASSRRTSKAARCSTSYLNPWSLSRSTTTSVSETVRVTLHS